MSNLVLYLSIGGVLFLAWVSHFFHKSPNHLMMDEWRDRMKKLDTEKPMMSRIEGKPGVSTIIKKKKVKKAKKITEINPVRKTGSR